MEIENLGNGKIGVWVSNNKYNVCLTMIMYDFIDWCREFDINVEVDMSWNNHRGFVIESKDQELVRTEIKRFIDMYNLKPGKEFEKFSGDEWYS